MSNIWSQTFFVKISLWLLLSLYHWICLWISMWKVVNFSSLLSFTYFHFSSFHVHVCSNCWWFQCCLWHCWIEAIKVVITDTHSPSVFVFIATVNADSKLYLIIWHYIIFNRIPDVPIWTKVIDWYVSFIVFEYINLTTVRILALLYIIESIHYIK